MHTNALAIFDKYAMPQIRGKVLEVGAGKKFWLSPYRRAALDNGWDYRFCDYGNHGKDQPDFVEQPGEYNIKMPDGFFDSVISQQCAEHCPRPWLLAAEMGRVLKRGGHLAIIVPWSWKYHRCPRRGGIDCWRMTHDGMKVILEEAGCKPLVCKMEHITDNEAERGQQFVPGSRVYDTIGIGVKE